MTEVEWNNGKVQALCDKTHAKKLPEASSLNSLNNIF